MNNSDKKSTDFSRNKNDILGNIAVFATAAVGSGYVTVALPSIVAGVCTVLLGAASVACIQDYRNVCKKKGMRP